MREIRIKKKTGGHRIVVCPPHGMKRKLRAFIPKLQAVAMVLDVYRVQHGFVPGRSPVTNALPHRGYRWTLCCDLEDCFDHLTWKQWCRAVGKSPIRKAAKDRGCFWKNVARQGLPTSPSICNIILAQMDADIVRELGNQGVYTRYADDLTISANDQCVIDRMRVRIKAIVAKYGQSVSERKTRIQSASQGRRTITGVAVDDGIHPTRSLRRRLRAARHQQNQREAQGLEEWCRLREPNLSKSIQRLITEGGETRRQIASIMANNA